MRYFAFLSHNSGWKAWKLYVCQRWRILAESPLHGTNWSVKNSMNSKCTSLDDRAPPPILHASPQKDSGPRTQQQRLGWSGLNTTTPGRADELLDLLSSSAPDTSIADVTLCINYIWKDAISFCYLSNCVLHKLQIFFFVWFFFVMQGKRNTKWLRGESRRNCSSWSCLSCILRSQF